MAFKSAEKGAKSEIVEYRDRFMRNKMFFLFLMIPVVLLGDIESHLKQIPDKAEGHSIRNIDFIYMINLDQRPEKMKSSLNQLSPYGIRPFRFSAVNGWELSLEALDDLGLKYSIEMESGVLGTRYPLDGNFEPSHEILADYGKTYFCHSMSRGAIGIILSHLSILQDAYDAGYETIWVMEDDIEVIKNPLVLSDLVDRLDQVVGKGKWDILFTDRDIRDAHGNSSPCYAAKGRPDFKTSVSGNNFAERTAVSQEFSKIGARWGAHSMILRRSGMRKLLQYFKAHQIFFPYDMEYILPPGIKLYAVLQDVVSNLPRAASDNGGPNYLESFSRG